METDGRLQEQPKQPQRNGQKQPQRRPFGLAELPGFVAAPGDAGLIVYRRPDCCWPRMVPKQFMLPQQAEHREQGVFCARVHRLCWTKFRRPMNPVYS